jgi:glycosyltransferase involved in cell wall biosynthesis
MFVGHTDQVERYYAAADAFVLPTPYDSFGLVVTEAMACGLPVIVSREAGAAELIRHHENGLLLQDYASVDELTSHMRFLLSDPERASEIGAAARRSVEGMSWDAVAQQTMAVYQEAARTSG